MAALTREEILGALDCKPHVIQVPEWGGGTVLVRSLSSLERCQFQYSTSQLNAGDDPAVRMAKWRSEVVAFCTVGDDGKPLFTPEDIPALEAKNGAAVERVYRAADNLNKLTALALEGERKNS